MLTAQQLAAFEAEVQKCLRKAEDIFGVDLTRTKVLCTIRGRCAGRAYSKDHYGYFKLNFNPEAVLKYNEDMVQNTIPHEVAHLVCFANPTLGRNHNPGWRRVHDKLGGEVSRLHTMKLTSTKTTVVYQYNINGHIINIPARQHKSIQEGVRQYRTSSHITGRPVNILPSMWVRSAVPNVVVPVAAQMPATSKQQSTSAGSKRERAQALFVNNRHLSRKDMIELFIAQADMTKAGASTYYQTFKSSGI